MSNAMVCPECHSEVEPTWDWCHACGFDPDGLRPSSRIKADAGAPGSVSTAVAPQVAPARVAGGGSARAATAPEGLLASTKPAAATAAGAPAGNGAPRRRSAE